MVEETLTGNDKWYCSKCKDHVTAKKKMEIWKAPDYLIIHLKRFSHTRNAMFGSRKLNDFINFPVNSLDMSPYILNLNGGGNNSSSAAAGSSDECKYDLYAVSNHFGSLSGGHYTAFARNPYYKKWYNFDDSDVGRATEQDIVTKAAYVLFYRRRGAAM